MIGFKMFKILQVTSFSIIAFKITLSSVAWIMLYFLLNFLQPNTDTLVGLCELSMMESFFKK